MKIQNKKKIQNASLSTLLASILVVGFIVPTMNSAYSQTECADTISSQMQSAGHSLDTAKAISTSNGNNELKSKTQGYNMSFYAVFNEWSFDPVNCTGLTSKDVNLVYSVNNANGSFVRYEVVTEDPTLTKVLSITEQQPRYFTGTSFWAGIWAGYEFGGSSFTYPTLPTTAVYEAKATYTLPSVSQPSSGKCTSTVPCDLAIWPGLADNFAASNNHLAQAGSDEQIICNPTCSTSTFFWYEFLPSSAFTCGGVSISSGDSISIDVTNEAKTGGTNTKYDVSMQDLTSGGGCSLSGQSYTSMSKPVLAEFINERATYSNGNQETIAKFGSDTITGTMYYSSGSHSISTPYSNGWWNQYTMRNPPNASGVTNVTPGSASSSSFAETWSSSANT